MRQARAVPSRGADPDRSRSDLRRGPGSRFGRSIECSHRLGRQKIRCGMKQNVGARLGVLALVEDHHHKHEALGTTAGDWRAVMRCREREDVVKLPTPCGLLHNLRLLLYDSQIDISRSHSASRTATLPLSMLNALTCNGKAAPVSLARGQAKKPIATRSAYHWPSASDITPVSRIGSHPLASLRTARAIGSPAWLCEAMRGRHCNGGGRIRTCVGRANAFTAHLL